jgi:hypothetical protein
VVVGSPGGIDLDPAMGEPVLAQPAMASDVSPIAPMSAMNAETDL